MNIQPNNPLHCKKLVDMLNELVEDIGWENLGHHININCFRSNPSIKSSLTFLRKTPWAREKFEQLYLAHYSKHQSMPQQTDPWKKVIEKKK